ncbi:unnamed protein product [Ostreobium quekettii]|uniref:Uncharacterized protein n=1 Tax=Ostreobium quekettii TaxID=121088 RepID=A0A8S1IT98_9CHLO|nr:unnamed protein product [Ostreobium quekettii]|eukprot:evm.model.scf_59.6 EVM.evm.TU.scf_59.6   scf_59:43730-46073(-)
MATSGSGGRQPAVKKRRTAGPPVTAQEVADSLLHCHLTGVFQFGGVWLSVDDATAAILDSCCIGTVEGGPTTAKETAATLRIGENVQAGSVSILLTLQEAAYYKCGWSVLQIYQSECTGGIRNLSDEEFWSACTHAQPAFVASYVAYHHFRSKVGGGIAGLCNGAICDHPHSSSFHHVQSDSMWRALDMQVYLLTRASISVSSPN